MSEFKQYRRKQIAELRPVTKEECKAYFESPIKKDGFMKSALISNGHEVSVSKEDRRNGSPKLGDMIARNPKNHNDQWLVAKEYFQDNFEEL